MRSFGTREQKALKDAAAAFAAKKLNDGLARRDREGVFSRAGWKACADFGLQGMFLPSRYGGMGLKPLEMAAVLEGIGHGARDNGLIFSVNAHLWACVGPIARFGTQSQKEKFLPGLGDGSLIGAHAMTEAESGSDVYALKTQARRAGNHYILNGDKVFVTNAPVADIFIVFARTGCGANFSSLSCFLVEKNTKGLNIGKPCLKMGLRTSPMADVVFKDCRIPEGHLLGKEGSGAVIFQEAMEQERIFVLANSIGIMERLIGQCALFAGQRKIFNKPLAQHPSFIRKLRGMEQRLERSRSLICRAAACKQKGRTAYRESVLAKLITSEAYVQNCREALQIHGATGYMVETGLERELRDALASTLYSGTSEVLRGILERLS